MPSLKPRTMQQILMVESDLSNAIGWVSSPLSAPWRLQFHLNVIKFLASWLQVEFKSVGRSVNAFADSLAKQGVDRASPFVVFSL